MINMGIFYTPKVDEPVIEKTDVEIAMETYDAFDLNLRENEVLTESATFYNETEKLHALKESIELEFAKTFAHVFMNPTVEYTLEHQALLNNIGFRYASVMESLGVTLEDFKEEADARRKTLSKKSTEVIDSGKKKIDRSADVVKKGVKDGKKTLARKKKEFEPTAKKISANVKTGGSKLAKAIKALPNAFRYLVDNTYGRLKKMNEAERRKAILEGGLYKKLSTLVRMGLKIGTTVALGPVLGSIFLLSSIIRSHDVSRKIKRDLVDDMKQEVVIVKEKIRDADSSGDKNAKYQLMRIKDNLERDINNVENNQKNKRSTNPGEVN